MGFVDDFFSIGDESFWASPEYTFFSTALIGIALILSLLLSFKLLSKYKKYKKKSVLYLGLAFLFIIIGMLLAIPIAFEAIPCEIIKVFEGTSKVVVTFAINFYFMFAIAIFYSKGEKSKKILAFQAIFVAVNLALVIINYTLEAIYCIQHGTNMPRPVLVLIQEFFITLPLIMILVQAWRLSKKTSEEGDKKALQFIAWSGFFKFMAFLSMAIDDFIALDNPWSFPTAVFMILGFVYFYLGVARPKKVFARYASSPAGQ